LISAWPKVLVTAVVLVVVGVLVWQFAPIDDAIDAVLPTFNNTGNQWGASGPTPISNPTLAPSTAERFEFMLCNDQDMDCCNGLDSICDLGVDDILYATVHNAMASFEDGFLFGPNHRYNLESALEAGYRGINLDVCNCGGVYQFCHGGCSFGSRDIDEVFTNINTFMDENPTEVVVITIQMNSKVDQAVDLAELYAFMTAVPGFSEKFYEHPNLIDDWPTLRGVIESNKVREDLCTKGYLWLIFCACSLFKRNLLVSSASSRFTSLGKLAPKKPLVRPVCITILTTRQTTRGKRRHWPISERLRYHARFRALLASLERLSLE
jgi:hypothetical protein